MAIDKSQDSSLFAPFRRKFENYCPPQEKPPFRQSSSNDLGRQEDPPCQSNQAPAHDRCNSKPTNRRLTPVVLSRDTARCCICCFVSVCQPQQGCTKTQRTATSQVCRPYEFPSTTESIVVGFAAVGVVTAVASWIRTHVVSSPPVDEDATAVAGRYGFWGRSTQYNPQSVACWECSERRASHRRPPSM